MMNNSILPWYRPLITEVEYLLVLLDLLIFYSGVGTEYLNNLEY